MSTLYQRVFSTEKHKNYKVNIERYDSAMEVVEHCKTRPITDSRFTNMDTKDFDEGWEGVSSYSQALDYLKNGYQPTVDKLKETMKATAQGNGKRISFQNQLAGFAPIVPLALMGVPNSMIGMTMKPIKCKVVDIYYDMSCTADTAPRKILENGQKLLGAIMSLEKQGYKFNLYATQTYCGDKDTDMLIVKIKSSDKPIDLKRMSFPLTHPAFFRVIGFDWYNKTPKGTYRSGRGTDLKYIMNRREQKDFEKHVLGENALYIKGSDIRDEGEQHIKEVLKTHENTGKN